MLANVCSTKWREPRVGTWQNLEKRPEAKAVKEWWMLTGLLFIGLLCLHLRTACPGVVQPREGWVILYQSFVKKMSHRFPYRPVVQKHFLKWGFLFPDDPSGCQFDQTSKHFHKHTLSSMMAWNTLDRPEWLQIHRDLAVCLSWMLELKVIIAMPGWFVLVSLAKMFYTSLSSCFVWYCFSF